MSIKSQGHAVCSAALNSLSGRGERAASAHAQSLLATAASSAASWMATLIVARVTSGRGAVGTERRAESSC